MITILFSQPKKCPAYALAKTLADQVPPFTWTIGEDDTGSEAYTPRYSPPLLLAGRGGGTTLFMDVRQVHGDEPALPPHAQRVVVNRPTTEDDGLAERVALIAALTMAFADRDHALLRVPGSDHWLTVEESAKLAELVLGGEAIATLSPAMGRPADALTSLAPAPEPTPARALETGNGNPPAPGLGHSSNLRGMPYDDRAPAVRGAILGANVLGLAANEKGFLDVLREQDGLASIYDFSQLPVFHDEQVRADRLPTLVLLANQRLALDVAKLTEGLGVIDPEGGWTVTATDSGLTAHGRDTVITLANHAFPLPAYMVELGLDRSLGATEGEAMRRLRQHTHHVTLSADVDPTSADWTAVRETAKAMVMTMAIAHMPQGPGGNLVGVYNAATASFFTDDMIPDLVGALAQGEVSIKTFIWHAFPSREDGRISISSAGMLPFIGREVEILDAPGDIPHVGEQLNMIERYLLMKGPVMGDGDTIKTEEDAEPLARAFHAMSDAHGRAEPVPVLRFEIRGPDGRWRPRHDPPRGDAPLGSGGGIARPAPAADPAPAPARPTFGRRAPGGFGRKGL
ncbi:DUF4261 domain-containing protein [Sphingomicrobium arenosum]|uniref:DUF4261 domain-containing protein n=1 Tax=Sphingomicrobium arenosum TaxID=2233861 RepID=UPI002240F690|nr:DUF4261 domain-containing protein [Sphingomicrobium arenosum]